VLAWDAELEYQSPQGIRRKPATEWYITSGKTALHHDEVLTALIIPKEKYQNYYGHYIKYALRNAMDIALLGCSVNVRLSPDKQRFLDLRMAYGVAGPIPIRVPKAEQSMRGLPVNAASLNAASAAVLEEINPRSSWRADRELRMQIAEELTKRGLKQAVQNAGGSI
jgi:xanthine dehydrogenase FAD-binding subunit